jgi:hypothetical protein
MLFEVNCEDQKTSLSASVVPTLPQKTREGWGTLFCGDVCLRRNLRASHQVPGFPIFFPARISARYIGIEA